MRTWGHGRFKGFKILPSLEKEVFLPPEIFKCQRDPPISRSSVATDVLQAKCPRPRKDTVHISQQNIPWTDMFLIEFPPSPSMFSSITIPQRCKTSSHWIQNPRNLMLIASPQTKMHFSETLKWLRKKSCHKKTPEKCSVFKSLVLLSEQNPPQTSSLKVSFGFFGETCLPSKSCLGNFQLSSSPQTKK